MSSLSLKKQHGSNQVVQNFIFPKKKAWFKPISPYLDRSIIDTILSKVTGFKPSGLLWNFIKKDNMVQTK